MRVIIVGHGTPGNPPPFGQDNVHLWGINAVYQDFAPEDVLRFQSWFQLHSPEYMTRHWSEDWPAHRKWLELPHHPFPVYMQRHYEEFPRSQQFPRERIIHELPRGNYQTCTASWLISFAILEGYEEIVLWGINGGPGEPLAARPCLEWWLGVAVGKGIKVGARMPTDLWSSCHWAVMDGNLEYAYDPEPALELGGNWQDRR